ncbi:MAG: hypothetical protein QMB03_00855, partial [Spirosomataceae bacterium]
AYDGACSVECKKHPRKRFYDGTGYHARGDGSYSPESAFKARKNTKKLHIIEDLQLAKK